MCVEACVYVCVRVYVCVYVCVRVCVCVCERERVCVVDFTRKLTRTRFLLDSRLIRDALLTSPIPHKGVRVCVLYVHEVTTETGAKYKSPSLGCCVCVCVCVCERERERERERVCVSVWGVVCVCSCFYSDAHANSTFTRFSFES